MTSGPGAIATAVVAGAVQVGMALKGVADETLRLRTLSEDTGVSESKLSILMRGQEILGIEPGAALQNIQKLTVGLKNITARRGWLTGLRAMGQHEFAKEIGDLTDKGDYAKAVDRIIENASRMESLGEIMAQRYADVFDVDRSFLSRIGPATRGLAPAFHMNAELAQSWADRVLLIQQNARNQWNWTVGNLIWGLNRLDEYTAGNPDVVGAAKRGFLPNLEQLSKGGAIVRKAFPTILNPGWWVPGGMSPGSGNDVKDLKDSKKESSGFLNDINSILLRMFEKSVSIGGLWVGGSTLPGRAYLVGERGPETFSSGGSSRIVGVDGPEILRTGESGTVEPPTTTLLDNWKEGPPDTPPYYFRPPRAVPGDPEKTWERLNRALKDRPGIGYSEDAPLPGQGTVEGNRDIPIVDWLRESGHRGGRSASTGLVGLHWATGLRRTEGWPCQF